MSPLCWLAPGAPFPPTHQALREPDGLLAAGADLAPDTLLRAYRHGIFPWFSPADPILWWSPDPRLVLLPEQFHLSRRLARSLRQPGWQFSLNHAFNEVISACATVPRRGQPGTWISADMQSAYQRLHQLGHAHSLEVWWQGELVGGVYGVRVGAVFFGESMFSRRRDASKAALATLCRLHRPLHLALLDCQVESAHLLSLGARVWPRHQFEQALVSLTAAATACWPVIAPLSRQQLIAQLEEAP